MAGDHYLHVLTPDIAKPSVNYPRKLGYLTPEQADDVLKLFDSKEADAKNFTTLKAIARGLVELLEEGGLAENQRVSKMFQMVNNRMSASI